MPEYRTTTRRDWIEIVVRLASMFVIIFAGLALLGPANIVFMPLVFIGSLVWIILWHTRTFGYRCSNCEQDFEISALQNLAGPHYPDLKGRGWKILKCPHCLKISRAQVLRKVVG
jgi:hypothetical protein